MAQVNALPVGFVGPVTGALTTTGPSAVLFTMSTITDGQDKTLWLGAIGAGAVPTALTVDLEVSFDGQLTWQKLQTGIALVATTVATPQKIINAPRGLPMRLNATTLTLGSASSITVYGVC